MAENLSKNNIEQRITNSLNTLKELLNNWINSNSKNLKRASLLSYWINDYSKLLTNEDSYSPPNHKYKRGDIVRVNFGYRIGNELGGVHFAVVLDCNNSKNSTQLTVVPLSSYRKKHDENFFILKLDTGLFELHKEKVEKTLSAISYKISELEKRNDLSQEKLSKETSDLNNKMLEAERLLNAVEKLKNGTSVLTSQITTISKQRLISPKTNHDSLSGIRLKPDDLKRLNAHLIRLYIKNE